MIWGAHYPKVETNPHGTSTRDEDIDPAKKDSGALLDS